MANPRPAILPYIYQNHQSNERGTAKELLRKYTFVPHQRISIVCAEMQFWYRRSGVSTTRESVVAIVFHEKGGRRTVAIRVKAVAVY